MKNKILKILSIFMLIVMSVMCLPAATHAAEQTASLFSISETKNMAVAIGYDKQAPSVRFIAPNGAEYGNDAITAGLMSFSDSGDRLYYRIPNAMAGNWSIVYDKGQNKDLDIVYAPYAEAITIQSFSFAVTSDTTLDASFNVTHSKGGNYSYTLWAVVTDGDYVTGKKALTSGSASANQAVSVSAGTDSLTSYGSYRLMLEVKINDGGIEAFDSKVSDAAFAYTNPNTPQAIENFYAEIGTTDDNILLDWSKYKLYCEGYIVSIYEDDAAEPYYISEFESNITSTDILINSSASKLRVELAYKSSGGVVSAPAVKEIDMSMADLLTISDDEITSASQLRVDYNFTAFPGTVKTVIDVNGEIQEAMPEGKGTFSIAIDEFENEVNILWYADENLAFRVHSSVYSDRTAPMLLLYEAASNIRTKEGSYILAGTTDAGCTVTVNGKEVEVKEDGTFSIKLSLNDGMNEFTVTAKSSSGNSSKQTLSIERVAAVIGSDNSVLGIIISYLPLIVSFLIALILCGHIFLSTKLFAKYSEKKGRVPAVFIIASNTFILFAAIFAVAGALLLTANIMDKTVLDSIEFYKAASKSIASAYEMMQKNNALLISAIISFVAMVLMIVLAVVSRRIAAKSPSELPKLFEKKQKTPKKPKPETVKPTQNSMRKAEQKGCPHCGVMNDADSDFCENCGNPMKESGKKKCPHCGFLNDAEAGFCENCGGTLE